MKPNEFHELVLKDLAEMKADIKEVRQTDLPNLKTDLAVFKVGTNKAIKDLDDKTKWSTRVYTVVGGAIAVLTARFTSGSH